MEKSMDRCIQCVLYKTNNQPNKQSQMLSGCKYMSDNEKREKSGQKTPNYQYYRQGTREERWGPRTRKDEGGQRRHVPYLNLFNVLI